jgi:ferredoxin
MTNALLTVMAYVISKKCVGTCDTACVDVCPCDCIVGPVSVAELRRVPAELRGAAFPAVQLYIDPDECIDCGACLPECPVDAIAYQADSSPTDIERNARFFAALTGTARSMK